MNITQLYDILTGPQILSIIASSLSDAILQKDNFSFNDNSKKSSLFVSNLGEKLYQKYKEPDCLLKVIKVSPNGDKIKGEWLLDIAITKSIEVKEKNHSVHAVSILEWAIESESSSALIEFANDFSKLAVVKAHNYLYLHGFNQGSEKATEDFIRRRLNNAKIILEESGGVPDSFFIAFWPSPEKPKFKTNAQSIWDLITQSDLSKFNHLKKIHLYQLTEKDPIYIGFKSIHSMPPCPNV